MGSSRCPQGLSPCPGRGRPYGMPWGRCHTRLSHRPAGRLHSSPGGRFHIHHHRLPLFSMKTHHQQTATEANTSQFLHHLTCRFFFESNLTVPNISYSSSGFWESENSGNGKSQKYVQCSQLAFLPITGALGKGSAVKIKQIEFALCV